jgi:predicted metal-binding protein/2-polyprenyl-3-methyl-5-hydroxy-6-metoxy-1,4-benzoquinol methylase
MKLPHQDSDPAHTDFQYLEDLSTAYWYSEAFFAALELKIFEFLGQGDMDTAELAARASCDPDALLRLLKVLRRLDLIDDITGKWVNSQAINHYLVRENNASLSDFLLYRRVMQSRWQTLAQKLSVTPRKEETDPLADTDYETRNRRYVRAQDALAREKAEEIVDCLDSENWQPPILDIGGGGGALSRALIRTRPEGTATLFDLPEVVAAARSIYPDQASWERFHIQAGDFRNAQIDHKNGFGLIIMSNFLHAYGAREAEILLHKAVALLAPDGLLLIHDYFPDRMGRSPHKGPLYDLNMMLNTHNGRCHEANGITAWLHEAGVNRVAFRNLSTDTGIILAGRREIAIREEDPYQDLRHTARKIGFRRAVLLDVSRIAVVPWARIKCRYGCARYGKNLRCPPHGPESEDTRKLLSSYSKALILEGAPPGRDFHDQLLKMEKHAFLSGCHKAFALGAGPCPVCHECPDDGTCRYPGKARPSMEASGIDVYESIRNAGLKLKPAIEKNQYAKYFGMLLLE